jgi:hypothetical protein
MPDSNQIGMYICLAFASIFFLLAIYVKSTGKWPGQEDELGDDEVSSRVKWLIVLSGIFIILSSGIALKRKSSIVARDVLEMTVVVISVLISWIIAWKDCSEFAMSLSVLSAILACTALDTQQKLK